MEKSDKTALIKELNELSSDSEKNLERMQEIAKVLLREHFAPRNNKSICEYGLDNIKCSECLFDTLCNQEKMEVSSQE